MHILVTGLDHKTAPIELRESVAFTTEELPRALAMLSSDIGQMVILSTCNRTEVYTVVEEPAAVSNQIRRFMNTYHGIHDGFHNDVFRDHINEDAVRHLFRVAAGVESLMVGESQILGQVRNALTAASDADTLSAPISRLFHRAIRSGRKVRDETDLGRNSPSVSSAAARLAQESIGSLEGLRVLLIGAGEAGKLVASALRSIGAKDLTIVNRTYQRAKELANELGGTVVAFEELDDAVSGAEIVISATEVATFVLKPENIFRTEGITDRGKFVFDMGMPRNIDPEIGLIPGITLYNIDDLSSIAESNVIDRTAATLAAEAIIELEVNKFIDWWSTLDTLPLVIELRERAELLRKRELGRALSNMVGISEDYAEVVEDMSRAIVNKLLHSPTVSLKQHPDEETIRVARELFDLRDDLC